MHPAEPRLSVVVVTHNEADAITGSLPPLVAELRDGDELIVVDNGSTDGSPEIVAAAAPDSRVVRNTDNRGFMAAVNAGAREAGGDLLVLLNPDAVVQPGWREGIAKPWTEDYGWSAWQGLVTTDEGRHVNSDGNVIHFTGICWAGGVGEDITSAGAQPREVPYASGACLAVPLALWLDLDGFPEYFFLYGDDVDISLRLRLRGERIGIEPSARVDHDYVFDKGKRKWRFLERSRWAFLIRTYPAPLLVLTMPALLATEVALLPISAASGWLPQKLLANLDVLRWAPRLLAERREIQRRRLIGTAPFAAWLTADLTSPYLGAAAQSNLLRSLLRIYLGAMRIVLGRAQP